ncbi:hypothetical protein CXB51_032678 [Gossypium anomalum]|uniref:Uncharacterized protein n=1 Tax=Gossypium anomalum TaxID=47600 RepID=A0A8J5YTB8_9ROSI|nr:hypothetical protein CXB51_032678 [Gossypium anomalum]
MEALKSTGESNEPSPIFKANQRVQWNSGTSPSGPSSPLSSQHRSLPHPRNQNVDTFFLPLPTCEPPH